MADIYVAGTKVARPASIKVGRFDLTRSARTDSGRMTIEIIRAGIRRVDVGWAYMEDTDLETLLDLLAQHKPFFELRYPDAGGQKVMTCYVGDINTSLWHTVDGIKRWDEVSMPFIEQ